MEYVTINQLNEFRVVMTNWWIILASITCMWCSASIIIELAKIYAFKGDTKEVFRSIFNILKTLIYMIPMGMISLIASELYNNSNFNLGLICKVVVVVVAIISISISIIYKSYNKKQLNNLNVNEEQNLKKDDIE